jgi:hypothetical protein
MSVHPRAKKPGDPAGLTLLCPSLRLNGGRFSSWTDEKVEE